MRYSLHTAFSVFLLGICFLQSACAEEAKPSVSSARVIAEIKIQTLGFDDADDCRYHGNDVPPDLSQLNDDSKIRLAFVDENTLILYRSHCRGQPDKAVPLRAMEGVFVNPATGAITGREAWPTVKRRWLNDRWDTEARIMAVEGGFLVHAGNSLHLYSSMRQEKAVLPLDADMKVAVAVSPSGRTIHLQRIRENNEAQGEWLSSDNLKSFQEESEYAGVTSVSDDALLHQHVHCVMLQEFGKSPRDLYCADPGTLGYPVFLTNSEIISSSNDGFSIFSLNGQKLWSREIEYRHTRGRSGGIWACKSLDGSRFAMMVSSNDASFEGVNVSNRKRAVFVYDRSARALVSYLDLGPVISPTECELAGGGRMLAVLAGSLVRIYQLPK